MFIIISIFPRPQRLLISGLLRLLPPRPRCLFLPSPLRLLLTRPYHLLTRPLGLFLPCHEGRPYRSSFIDYINNLFIYMLLFCLFSLRC